LRRYRFNNIFKSVAGFASVSLMKTLLILVATLVAPATVLSAQETLLTSNGHSIDARPAAGLSCAQISEHLAAIDETGYRNGGPAPVSNADGAVYDYELNLSVAFFWRCATRIDEEAQNDAFRSGFTEIKTN
jgi:hypothetical protein